MFNILKKKENTVQLAGRSMVEMLGVLAIIGVLGMMGILGYRSAMDKFRANDTLSELNLRAVTYAQKMENLQTPVTQIELTDIEGEKSKMGYPLKATGYPDFFEIQLQSVPSRVCQNILDSHWNRPFETNVVRKSENVCDEMQFKFYNELETDTSSKENSDTEDKSCSSQECGGHGTAQYDEATKGCVCVCDSTYYGPTCSDRCPAGQTSYCSYYNADGSCRSLACKTGSCSQQSFSVYGGSGACCKSGESAYCLQYDKSGKCLSASCANTTCTQQPFPVYNGLGACCRSGQTPYCEEYDSSGNCWRASCSNWSCIQQSFPVYDGSGACCETAEEIQCLMRDDQGRCTMAGCVFAPPQPSFP